MRTKADIETEARQLATELQVASSNPLIADHVGANQLVLRTLSQLAWLIADLAALAPSRPATRKRK